MLVVMCYNLLCIERWCRGWEVARGDEKYKGERGEKKTAVSASAIDELVGKAVLGRLGCSVVANGRTRGRSIARLGDGRALFLKEPHFCVK